MDVYDYLILGGGMTAHAAVKGIRELDLTSSIGLITEEPNPPYKRPLLSKGLWKGRSMEEIWYDTQAFNVHMHQSSHVISIDPLNHQVTDEHGRSFQYKKLLLAMGGRPRQFKYGAEDIIYFRTVDDYKNLLALSDQGRRIAVVGGGFIGSEISAALAGYNNKVSLIFPENGINGKILPADLSIFLNQYYEQHGIEVIPGHGVSRLERREDVFLVSLSDIDKGIESLREFDVVVAGLGIMPNDMLAKHAGLTVSDGVEVDEHLCASNPDIYAAGDVANFFSSALKKRIRIEHEDNSLQMGRCAGRNMAGDDQEYRHLSYFYSDLFDLGYEAVGDLDPRLDTYEDWSVPNSKGVIYYAREGRVCGVLLWNVWEKVPLARSLIEAGQPISHFSFKELIS